MATFNDSKKLQQGFFHSLSKVGTNSLQSPYESSFKSGHSVFGKDIFTDVVGFAVDEAAADEFATNNPNVLKKYVSYPLTAVPGSNNQAYMLVDSGKYVRPFIVATDVMDSSGNLSFGYSVKLYQGSDTFIPPTLGAWNIDSWAGLVLFNPGYTPIDLGWGAIKITCYAYVGETLDKTLQNIKGNTFTATVAPMSTELVAEVEIDDIKYFDILLGVDRGINRGSVKVAAVFDNGIPSKSEYLTLGSVEGYELILTLVGDVCQMYVANTEATEIICKIICNNN